MGRPLLSFGRCALLVLAGAAIALTVNPALEFPLAINRIAHADEPPGDETLELTGLQSSFQAIARRASGSVVAISASASSVKSEHALRADELNGEALSAVLNGKTRIVGTGFVIDSDGYIVTNEHVVGDAEHLWVTTDDRRVYPAIVIGSDPRADLAVLKIPAANLPVVEYSMTPVTRGQWTIALGNPYGLSAYGQMSMSVGVVSATGRALPKLANKEDRLYTNLIQTTAEINPGNSGGPLFDLEGRVIGINTAVILPQKQTNGIGFAMPITDRLLEKIDALKQGNEIVYGFLGVRVVSPTPRQLRDAGIDRIMGAYVEVVEPDSPAAQAGIQPGDILLALDGRSIPDSDAFVRVIGDCTTDRPTALRLVRSRREIDLQITLGRRTLPHVAITRENQRFRWRGMLLGPVPAHWTNALGERPAGGLMILAVEPDSDAMHDGAVEGSILTQVAGQVVQTIADLQRVINDTPAEQCAIRFDTPRSAVVTVE